MKTPWFALAVLAALEPRARASHCHEHSRAVGYERCSWFGEWSRDLDVNPISGEWGWLHQEYVARPSTLAAMPVARSATGGSPFATASDGATGRPLFGMPNSRLFYGGVEIDIGSLTTLPQFAGLVGSGVSVNGLAVVGAHASLWRLAAAVELAGGVRVTNLWYGPTLQSTSFSVEERDGVVEARVRVMVFPTSHWSVGFAYGHSLLDVDDHSFSIVLGGHWRAIDGMY